MSNNEVEREEAEVLELVRREIEAGRLSVREAVECFKQAARANLPPELWGRIEPEIAERERRYALLGERYECQKP